LSFDPCNHSLKFRESTRLHLPKWELPWECECSRPHTPSHFLTLPRVCDVTPRLPLGPHPCNAFALTPGLPLGAQPCNPLALVTSPKLGLRQVGLAVQPYKWAIWSLSGLHLRFSLPSSLCTPIGGIRVLGVPLGSLSFMSFVFQNVLDNDVQHIDALFKWGLCMLHLGFSFIFPCRGFITFFIFSLNCQIFNAC